MPVAELRTELTRLQAMYSNVAGRKIFSDGGADINNRIHFLQQFLKETDFEDDVRAVTTSNDAKKPTAPPATAKLTSTPADGSEASSSIDSVPTIPLDSALRIMSATSLQKELDSVERIWRDLQRRSNLPDQGAKLQQRIADLKQAIVLAAESSSKVPAASSPKFGVTEHQVSARANAAGSSSDSSLHCESPAALNRRRGWRRR